jgi:hypothetical protein
MASVLANLTAYEVTEDRKYLDNGKIAFDWFFGANSLSEPMYDPVTGGCYDGLTPAGPNFNQGSESTICCLLAQLAMAPYLAQLQGLDEGDVPEGSLEPASGL